ncbi:MAG: hypothetical protein VB824_09900 [Dehalococcoidia bacterium]
MLGSVGSIVSKRWILGIFALGMIAVMVATSANPWAEAGALPTSVTATVQTPTSIQVDWTAADGASTLPESGNIVDGYRVDCVPLTGSTVTGTVTGRTTVTKTLTVLASTQYTCSVFSSSNSTLPSSGVAASAVTTTATLATQLGSVVATPGSGSVQVGGGLVLSAVSKGADTGTTAITGLTVNWSVGSGGTVSAATGDNIIYNATTAGTTNVTASVTQSATGITKTDTIAINNFTPIADEPVEAPSDPAAADTPSTPDISDAADGTAAAGVLKPTSTSSTMEVSAGDASAVVTFPANAVSNGTAAAVRTDISGTAGSTASLPAGTSAVGSTLLTVALTDNAGDTYGSALLSSAQVSITIPLATVTEAGADIQGLSIYKASDAATGPWTKLSTTSANTGGNVQATANVRDFSSFRLGFETRDSEAAVLPSAGDVAPTATHALLLATLGLMLILGGGIYIQRQRRATETS